MLALSRLPQKYVKKSNPGRIPNLTRYDVNGKIGKEFKRNNKSKYVIFKHNRETLKTKENIVNKSNGQ